LIGLAGVLDREGEEETRHELAQISALAA